MRRHELSPARIGTGYRANIWGSQSPIQPVPVKDVDRDLDPRKVTRRMHIAMPSPSQLEKDAFGFESIAAYQRQFAGPARNNPYASPSVPSIIATPQDRDPLPRGANQDDPVPPPSPVLSRSGSPQPASKRDFGTSAAPPSPGPDAGSSQGVAAPAQSSSQSNVNAAGSTQGGGASASNVPPKMVDTASSPIAEAEPAGPQPADVPQETMAEVRRGRSRSRSPNPLSPRQQQVHHHATHANNNVHPAVRSSPWARDIAKQLHNSRARDGTNSPIAEVIRRSLSPNHQLPHHSYPRSESETGGTPLDRNIPNAKKPSLVVGAGAAAVRPGVAAAGIGPSPLSGPRQIDPNRSAPRLPGLGGGPKMRGARGAQQHFQHGSNSRQQQGSSHGGSSQYYGSSYAGSKGGSSQGGHSSQGGYSSGGQSLSSIHQVSQHDIRSNATNNRSNHRQRAVSDDSNGRGPPNRGYGGTGHVETSYVGILPPRPSMPEPFQPTPGYVTGVGRNLFESVTSGKPSLLLSEPPKRSGSGHRRGSNNFPTSEPPRGRNLSQEIESYPAERDENREDQFDKFVDNLQQPLGRNSMKEVKEAEKRRRGFDSAPAAPNNRDHDDDDDAPVDKDKHASTQPDTSSIIDLDKENDKPVADANSKSEKENSKKPRPQKKVTNHVESMRGLLGPQYYGNRRESVDSEISIPKEELDAANTSSVKDVSMDSSTLSSKLDGKSKVDSSKLEK